MEVKCVAGTIGHKLMSGKPTRIDLDKDTHVDVRCQVGLSSFTVLSFYRKVT
jgi:integrator complex subunit 11